MKRYGISKQHFKTGEIDIHTESILKRGYTILPSVLDEKELSVVRESMDTRYSQQEDEFGRDELISINEIDLLRAPLQYDECFVDLIRNPRLLALVKNLLGDVFHLHLQNGVLNRPNKSHHQGSWHRDLPYQEFIISRPIAISAFYCIDPFTSQTGSTFVLPYSHKEANFPSEEFVRQNEFQTSARPGDVLVFDSMVYHKAGYNSSDIIRRGINNVFVAPFIKQQLDLPRLLDGKYRDDSLLELLLGYKYQVAESVMEYRRKKLG